MPVSPICEVREGAGPFVPTAGGVNITPGSLVTVRLADTTDVTDWYLVLSGTDETTVPPALTGVDPVTHKVTTPATLVVFTMPAAKGTSLLFSSTTEGAGGPLTGTFGLYALTEGGRRVGSTGETREGSLAHGWVYLVNPLIRDGASVIWYNDGAPALGTSNVQAALDALKTTIYGRAIAATAPGDGEVYKWNAGANQWEPGTVASSFVVGGDLGDWTPPGTDHQRVIGIDTLSAPLLETAAMGKFVRVTPYGWKSPRAMVLDGTTLWVGEQDQSDNDLPIVRHIDLPTGDFLSETTLAPYSTTGVRDVAVDSSYVYCACWKDGCIAILDKALHTVVGWGTMPDLGVPGTQATSVCADDAGNFYVVGVADLSGVPTHVLCKFSTAACLGHIPGEVGPTTTVTNTDFNRIRKVRYGLGYLWLAGGQSAKRLFKYDPSDLSLVAASSETSQGMNVAFWGGYVYVTSLYPSTISKYDPTTVAVVDACSLAGTVSLPDGIAVDSYGYGIFLVGDVSSSSGTAAYVVDSGGMYVASTTYMPSFGVGEVVGYQDFWAACFDSGASAKPALYRVPLYGGTPVAVGPIALSCAVVDSLQGFPVSNDYPYSGQFLRYDGSKWAPGNIDNIQGYPVATTFPSTGYVLTWDGSQWTPQAAGGGFVVGGDLSGSSGSQTVIGLRGRTISTTAPTTGYFYRWSGTQWEPRPALYGLTTNAIATANASGVPQSLVGTVSGQVATWNGTQWVAQAPAGGGNPLLLTGVANPTGYIAHVGQLVGLRNINGTLTAVPITDFDIEQFSTAYYDVSVSLTAVDSGWVASSGPYAMDACALTGSQDNYVLASQGVQIALAYANGTNLAVRRLDYTGSGFTPQASATIACTTAPTFVTICSLTTTVAYIAYVDNDVGKYVRADFSTTPPTLSATVDFNDQGGTIDAVSVFVEWSQTGGVEQGPCVVWGLSGSTAVYLRMSRYSGGPITLGSSGEAVAPAASAVSPHGTISMWGSGWFNEVTGVIGEGGRWGFNASYNQQAWPSATYIGRGRVPRIDGPDISGTSPSYLIDSAVATRPGSGCWLDGGLHIGLAWGSKAGYADGTYAYVVDRKYGDWTARKPLLVGTTAGDLVDNSTYPALKLRAPTCRRITDRSFAFGGFQAGSDLLTFGVGYVKDGEVHVGYFTASNHYMYAPAGNVADERQRVIPIKLRDDRFCVLFIGKPYWSGNSPGIYVTAAYPIADIPQAVGVAYTTTDPMTILAYGPVVTTTSTGTMGEWCYSINTDWTTYSISYGAGMHFGYESRVGIFISTTQMLIVPTKSG